MNIDSKRRGGNLFHQFAALTDAADQTTDTLKSHMPDKEKQHMKSEKCINHDFYCTANVSFIEQSSHCLNSGLRHGKTVVMSLFSYKYDLCQYVQSLKTALS